MENKDEREFLSNDLLKHFLQKKIKMSALGELMWHMLVPLTADILAFFC